MEKIPDSEYRDNLADKIKQESDPQKRREILATERETEEYLDEKKARSKERVEDTDTKKQEGRKWTEEEAKRGVNIELGDLTLNVQRYWYYNAGFVAPGGVGSTSLDTLKVYAAEVVATKDGVVIWKQKLGPWSTETNAERVKAVRNFLSKKGVPETDLEKIRYDRVD